MTNMSGKEKNFVIRLVVRHEMLSLSDLCEILGGAPSIGHSVGEKRKTPKGRMLDGSHTHSLWGRNIDYYQTKEIFPSVMEFVFDMEARGANFRHLKEIGAQVNINVDVFSDSSVASVLRVIDLEILCSRGIVLGLELFKRN